MEGGNRAELKKQLLIIIVWSIIPIVAIYRFVGWHGIIVVSVLLNSKRLWQMMIQRNPAYAYILSAQKTACTFVLIVLLWQAATFTFYPEKPIVYDVPNLSWCTDNQTIWPLKVGDICRVEQDSTFVRWSGSAWETWIFPLLGWAPI